MKDALQLTPERFIDRSYRFGICHATDGVWSTSKYEWNEYDGEYNWKESKSFRSKQKLLEWIGEQI